MLALIMIGSRIFLRSSSSSFATAFATTATPRTIAFSHHVLVSNNLSPVHVRPTAAASSLILSKTMTSTTKRWMSDGTAEKAEKTEEEKAAIKAAREARK